MATRAIVTGLAAALLFMGGHPAAAQQAKCLAGKTKCMAKKATGLLKCEQLAETPGKPADPNAGGCVTKVTTKFDGGAEPAKGCFEKLEGKTPNDCLSFDDTAAAETAVDDCVAALVEAIDPAPIDQTKCGAGKKKCVSKYLAGLLKCHQLAQTPGKPNDPNANGCVDKATAKYDGGVDPSKGCFEKLEGKVPNDCQFFDDAATLAGIVQTCAADLEDLLENPTTTTSTSSTTTTTIASGGVVLKGALTATPGRFNYNLTLGLPGADAACNTNFPGTHACKYAELQSAQTAGDLDGLKDVGNNTVTSFWAIDPTAAATTQCVDDVPTGSNLNWEYGTAHTVSRGRRVDLNNAAGTLGPLQAPQQCNFSSHWVGCCQ